MMMVIGLLVFVALLIIIIIRWWFFLFFSLYVSLSLLSRRQATSGPTAYLKLKVEVVKRRASES